MSDILEYTVQLAHQAGELLCRHYSGLGIASIYKSDHTLVTAADLETDRFINTALMDAFPGEPVLSEEQRTCLAEPSASSWVVDPLDGTTNFSLGLHHWGVSIAHLINGWPDLAVVYFPLLRETYTARRGEGASFNGQKLKRPAQEQREACFAYCSRTLQRYRVSIPFKTRLLGSSAFDLCAVARGSAVVSFDATPKIWDLAAAWLIVEEAGGVVETPFCESPFPVRHQVEYRDISYPTLASDTPARLAWARQRIEPQT